MARDISDIGAVTRIPGPDGDISLNRTADHVVLLPDGARANSLAERLETLDSFDPRFKGRVRTLGGTHSNILAADRKAAAAAIAAHASGELLLSPGSFVTDGDTVTMLTVEAVMERVPMAVSMEATLRRAGVYEFVKCLVRKDTRKTMTDIVRRLMASFAMSVHGLAGIEGCPKQLLVEWTSYYLDEKRGRFREDLFGSHRAKYAQCFKEFLGACGRVNDFPDIIGLARQRRSDAQHPFYQDLLVEDRAHILPWLERYKDWRKGKGAYAKAYRQMYMKFVSWLGLFPAELVADPARFLAARRSPTFAEHLAAFADGKKKPKLGSRAKELRQAEDFTRFVADREMEADPLVRAAGVVTRGEIQLLKNLMHGEGEQARHDIAQSKPLPPRLYRLTREILEEGEAGWPGRVCREKVRAADGSVVEVYCPVLPTLYLTLFYLPLRVTQAKRLDSGEGDARRYVATTNTWVDNAGPSAGHWRSVGFKEDRGYAYRFPDEGEPVTGFNINTNKTGAPYRVPWQNEPLHALMQSLREWQETHNPILTPIEPRHYVTRTEDVDRDKLGKWPDIFPLFRLPGQRGASHVHAPPNDRKTNQFWQDLMAEVEARLAIENPSEPALGLVKKTKAGQYFGATYKPHGMRTAGITMLLHQKVPISIVSRLIAGHVSDFQTAYYFHMDPKNITACLDEAAQSAREAEKLAWLADFNGASDLEAALRNTVRISDDGVRAAFSMSPGEKLIWADTSIGICPNGGSRCDDGGPLLRKSTSGKGSGDLHGPVVGGARNCVMCRHFYTGLPWREPLNFHMNSLVTKFAWKSRRLGEIDSEVAGLEAGKPGLSPERLRKVRTLLDRLDVESMGLATDQKTLVDSIWHTAVLQEACVRLDREPSDATALVANTDAPEPFEWKETDEFGMVAMLNAAARVYPLLRDENMVAAEASFIDKMLFANGMVPISLAPLTDGQKARSREAMAQLLLKATNYMQRDQLVSGSVTLSDLGLDAEMATLGAMSLGAPVVIPPRDPGTARAIQ